MQKFKILAAFIIVIFCGAYVASVFAVPNFYKGSEEELQGVNELREWLDEDTQDFADLGFSWNVNIFARWGRYFEFQSYIGGEEDLVKRKQERIAEFDADVNAYIEKVAKAGIYFGKELPVVSAFAGLTEDDKREGAAGFLGAQRVELQKFIVAENKVTNKKPLRIIYEPETYISETPINQQLLQMFTLTIDSTSLSDAEFKFIRQNNLGGVVLLSNNVSNTEQVKSLTKRIQQANPSTHMYVMTDQEGGLVKRVYWDTVGSQKELGALNKQQRCEQYSQRDQLLKSLGINLNLGIVADVTSDPNSFIYSRTFGKDFIATKGIISQVLECTTKTMTTLKHYPGHGATNLDTHLGLAELNLTKQQWETTHLVPFTAITDNHAIMLGHLILDPIHKDVPATLSKKHVNYIRNQLKHQGLIMTDDMRMLDAAGRDAKQSALQAAKAGNDILLYSTNISGTKEVINYLKAQLKQGNLDPEIIKQANLRIITAKNNLIKASGYASVQI